MESNIDQLSEMQNNLRPELYSVENGKIIWNRPKDGSYLRIPLCNFVATIVAEETHDDGNETRMFQTISASLQSGAKLPEINIQAKEFPSLAWVAKWGARAIVYAGQSTRDHLRTAIQTISTDIENRTVYTHLGWRNLNDEWQFLHAGGAIGPNGNEPSFLVRLGNNRTADYLLPAPPTGDALIAAIRCTLKLLKLAPNGIGASLLSTVGLSPLTDILLGDFCVFFSGQTGTFKSCISALAQAHFGMRFSDRHFPGNWSGTDNSIERLAFLTKDCIFTIDDFNPRGSTMEIAQFHKKADRVIRAAGNQQGRDRLDSASSLRSQNYPRCMMVSSGEEIPKGHSLRARIWNVEIKSGDIDESILSALQSDASEGRLAQSMSAYIQWLAKRFDRLKVDLPKQHNIRRQKLIKTQAHRRTSDSLVKLLSGLESFLTFALEMEALTAEQAKMLSDTAESELIQLAHAQAEIQHHEDPTDQFMGLVHSALTAGRAYLVDSQTGAVPSNPGSYGWHSVGIVLNSANQSVTEYGWRGEKIGWVGDTEIYLEPNLAYSMICRILRDQNESIPLSAQTLWKRLKERGYSVATEKDKNTLKRTVEGKGQRVLVISKSVFHKGHSYKTGESGESQLSNPTSPISPVFDGSYLGGEQ